MRVKIIFRDVIFKSAAIAAAAIISGGAAFAQAAPDPAQCAPPTERKRADIVPGDRSAIPPPPKMEFCTEFPKKCLPWTGMTRPEKPEDKSKKKDETESKEVKEGKADASKPDSKAAEKPGAEKKTEKETAKTVASEKVDKFEIDPQIENFCFLNPHYCRPIEPPAGYTPPAKTPPLIDHILNICKRDTSQCHWLPEPEEKVVEEKKDAETEKE